MNYTKGIRDLLQANSKIDQNIGDKIYPLDAPSGTSVPYITYEVIGQNVHHSKDNIEYMQPRVEVVVYTATYAKAVEYGEAVRKALNRKTLTSSNPQFTIDQIFLEDESVEHLQDPNNYAYVSEFVLFVPLG